MRDRVWTSGAISTRSCYEFYRPWENAKEINKGKGSYALEDMGALCLLKNDDYIQKHRRQS